MKLKTDGNVVKRLTENGKLNIIYTDQYMNIDLFKDCTRSQIKNWIEFSLLDSAEVSIQNYTDCLLNDCYYNTESLGIIINISTMNMQSNMIVDEILHTLKNSANIYNRCINVLLYSSQSNIHQDDIIFTIKEDLKIETIQLNLFDQIVEHGTISHIELTSSEYKDIIEIEHTDFIYSEYIVNIFIRENEYEAGFNILKSNLNIHKEFKIDINTIESCFNDIWSEILFIENNFNENKSIIVEINYDNIKSDNIARNVLYKNFASIKYHLGKTYKNINIIIFFAIKNIETDKIGLNQPSIGCRENEGLIGSSYITYLSDSSIRACLIKDELHLIVLKSTKYQIYNGFDGPKIILRGDKNGEL